MERLNIKITHMVIYTKKGDRGQTTLYNQTATPKDSLKIRVIGAIDELNSFLGVVRSFCEDNKVSSQLKEVQEDLLTIGSILAGSNLRFFKTKTRRLEKAIGEIEKKLPSLKKFIIPGGSQPSSLLHYARTLARRAEQDVTALSEKENIKPQILSYLNRLSDYLFILARDVNFRTGEKEKVWVGRKK